MNNIFKKDAIKAGYLLRVKHGDKEFNMTVAPTKAHTQTAVSRLIFGIANTADGDLACCGDYHWWPVSFFNDDLETHMGDQVVAVYGYAPVGSILDNSANNRELLWAREEDKPEPAKKMTVAEIAEALGYPVEIVEG